MRPGESIGLEFQSFVRIFSPFCQFTTGRAVNRRDVQQMFNAIAPTYDLLNRSLSFGVDIIWRRRLMRSLGNVRGARTLDVACGSGDLMLSCTRAGAGAVIGVDLAFGMLRRANVRLQRAAVVTSVVVGAAEALPFRSGSFDVVTAAFGLRNFEDPDAGLLEMHRALVPGGRLRILEFSEPSSGLWGWLFRWYFRFILPRVGALISGHAGAYQYLHDSVQAFPSGPALITMMERAGFTETSFVPLSGGIATLYAAVKPAEVTISKT